MKKKFESLKKYKMKNNTAKIIGAISIAILLGVIGSFHPSTNGSEEINLSIKNLEALALVDPPSMDCWSITHNCLLFGCSNVTQCAQPCVVERADSWSNPGKCGPIN